MKRIGLMTCFLDNYGACLQAYALMNVINNLGYRCEIIRYTEPEGYFENSIENRIKTSKAYNTVRCMISSNYKKAYLCEKVRRKTFEKFRKKYLKFSAKEYKTFHELKETNEIYDIFVCGSDQIWNPTFYNGNNRAYFLDFVHQAKKKIAYAPSIGLSEFPEEYATDFARLIGRLDYVSVRESTGVNIIREVSGVEACHVLDPTLLMTGEQWNDLVSEDRIEEEKYIFCYLFGKHEEYTTAIQRLCEETGYKAVIIPFSEENLSDNYTKIYRAGPKEFLNLIKNAEYILTDSFHATVFSILFSKPFFSLHRFKTGEKNSMNSRLKSLLDIVGLSNRFIKCSDVSNFEINQDIDYENVHLRLNNVRENSLKYLQGALGNDENMFV